MVDRKQPISRVKIISLGEKDFWLRRARQGERTPRETRVCAITHRRWRWWRRRRGEEGNDPIPSQSVNVRQGLNAIDTTLPVPPPSTSPPPPPLPPPPSPTPSPSSPDPPCPSSSTPNATDPGGREGAVTGVGIAGARKRWQRWRRAAHRSRGQAHAPPTTLADRHHHRRRATTTATTTTPRPYAGASVPSDSRRPLNKCLLYCCAR